MLAHRLRRWPKIGPTLSRFIVIAGLRLPIIVGMQVNLLMCLHVWHVCPIMLQVGPMYKRHYETFNNIHYG